jgi:hypothetical protein
MAGFSLISLRLKELYQMLTLGGDAELELVDSFDPFAEGVVFSVRPPRKSWKNIANLSGGEKVHPPPLQTPRAFVGLRNERAISAVSSPPLSTPMP